MEIIFYTTGCPKCSVLKRKLDMSHLKYDVCRDIDEMLKKGLQNAPALEVDGTMYNFKEAIKFLNEQEVIK